MRNSLFSHWDSSVCCVAWGNCSLSRNNAVFLSIILPTYCVASILPYQGAHIHAFMQHTRITLQPNFTLPWFIWCNWSVLHCGTEMLVGPNMAYLERVKYCVPALYFTMPESSINYPLTTLTIFIPQIIWTFCSTSFNAIWYQVWVGSSNRTSWTASQRVCP